MIYKASSIAGLAVVAFLQSASSHAQQPLASPATPAQLTFEGIIGGKSRILNEVLGQNVHFPARARFGIAGEGKKISLGGTFDCAELLADGGARAIEDLTRNFNVDRLPRYMSIAPELDPATINPRSVIPTIPQAVDQGLKACTPQI